ncbi:hypothetical protein Psta_0361 [Pirellula staleyi DSM 6068]|uniref:Uncharacterized protein n=1 Tax=Pirellula staleyi (strain ATCC 27377 / DSM 6068 / ICPB 4128) TaxID=530564 RepID=D2R2E2_PIRSD|nr:hypothetical protein Psta_0361 [Pirellula staleyi DSM 6068]
MFRVNQPPFEKLFELAMSDGSGCSRDPVRGLIGQ